MTVNADVVCGGASPRPPWTVTASLTPFRQRSPSGTGPAAHLAKCRRDGGRFVPGRPFIYARSASAAPRKSAARAGV